MQQNDVNPKSLVMKCLAKDNWKRTHCLAYSVCTRAGYGILLVYYILVCVHFLPKHQMICIGLCLSHETRY